MFDVIPLNNTRTPVQQHFDMEENFRLQFANLERFSHPEVEQGIFQKCQFHKIISFMNLQIVIGTMLTMTEVA